MAINTNLLIAAPMLQNYFVDKDTGLPLAAGTITMYRDIQTRQTLKNWYYQVNVGTASSPNYSYITLPNPMTLSAVGTIIDDNGNAVIPFYYPYDEDSETLSPQAYYVVVKNSDGEIQFTPENFPFNPTSGEPSGSVPTNQNLIVNSNFWRNVSPNVNVNVGTASTFMTNTMSINSSTLYYGVLAPSQHDSFAFPDIRYVKNVVDGTENINFKYFTSNYSDQVLTGDPTPEFYLNINCSAAGTSTVRYILIPLSAHVRSLSSYTDGTFTIQALNVNSGSEVNITVGILQYLGSGVTSNAVEEETIQLSADWYKWETNLVFPTAQGKTLGEGNDDGFYIQIGLPIGSAFEINLALPSFYLSETSPTNSYETYDKVNSVISSPRTGDVRISNNSFLPYGWTAMNDGVIALNTPTNLQISRINSDVWPLYNLLWNLAKPYANGTSNPICQLYSNTGSAVAYDVDAYTDFVTNNRALALTQMMGRVLLGTVPIDSLINSYKTTFTASTSAGTLLLTTANNVNYFKGMPITFTTTNTLPTGIVANNVYYVGSFNGSNGIFVSASFALAMAGTYIAFTDAGSGVHTVISGNTGSIEGEYAHTPILAEMFAHAHEPSLAGSAFKVAVASGGINANTGGGTVITQVGSTNTKGSSTPFNVTQPGTFANIFIKL